mmetsp:Transcript_36452/g.81128  ORF Transcript_36452/g.81128 Transcript_36452/m.81128 type:complete len:211 (-) Transcript_36452:890-1522(-)
MACPALPLCGLAVTEAERGLPDVNRRIRDIMTKVGISKDESFVVRMTGCPNGCARPYMAELGFVGDGPNSYQVYLGGNSNQTRLATLFADRVKLKDFEAFFEPVFLHFKNNKKVNEGFGDYAARVGVDAIRAFQASHQAAAAPAPAVAAAANGNGNGNGNGAKAPAAPAAAGVALDPTTVEALKALAKAQGKTVEQLVAEAAKQLTKGAK